MLIKSTPIRLDSVSAVISDKVVPVEEYCAELSSPKKLRKIISTTGFEALSIVDPDVCCSDMCVQAAEHLFEAGGFSREEIGALIFVTQSPDYLVPATAYTMQKRLRLSSDLVAFDVTLGCSGFVYGLYVASSLLSGLSDKKVLLCCGDVHHSSKKPTSTTNSVIFGDAGAAVIVSRASTDKPTLFAVDSYGDRWQYLYKEDTGQRFKRNIDAGHYEPTDDGEPPKPKSYMDGMGIMDFTLNETVDNINGLLDAANVDRNDIGAYLFHQPQQLLLDDMSDRLKLNHESMISNAHHIGNASSASIPLLLTEIGSEWAARPNKRVLMSGFGVGLSVASTIMDLDDLVCLKTYRFDHAAFEREHGF